MIELRRRGFLGLLMGVAIAPKIWLPTAPAEALKLLPAKFETDQIEPAPMSDGLGAVVLTALSFDAADMSRGESEDGSDEQIDRPCCVTIFRANTGAKLMQATASPGRHYQWHAGGQDFGIYVPESHPIILSMSAGTNARAIFLSLTTKQHFIRHYFGDGRPPVTLPMRKP